MQWFLFAILSSILIFILVRRPDDAAPLPPGLSQRASSAATCPPAAAAAAPTSPRVEAQPAQGQLARFDFSAWAAALRSRAAALHPAQASAEAVIAAAMPTAARYALAARFPLPEIGAVVDLADGTCLLGHCEEMARGAATWGPDTHVRDLINSIMLPCALRWTADDCLAVDFGSNFGLHTLAMLQLGARVLSVEPQSDLCVASRASAAANGWAARSVILCGGVAASGDTPPEAQLGLGDGLHRYHGPRTVPNYAQPASMPLYTIGSLLAGLPAGAFLRLVKIDTDSIDCAVLAQVLGLVETGAIDVGAFILESWDSTCRGDNTIGNLVVLLLKKGYTVYRTHITERSWDGDHRDTAHGFAPIAAMPAVFREQFCQRFNFNLWVIDAAASHDQVLAVTAAQTQYQYIATKDPFLLPGYITAEQ